MLEMGKIRVRLPVVMAEHRIKQRQLAEAAGIRGATVNALYNYDPSSASDREGVQFGSLAKIIEGLRRLTGKQYDVSDLLEYIEDE